MDRETAEKWMRKFNRPLSDVNYILVQMNNEGIKPEIHVFQGPKELGEGLRQIEINMFPNPHYSEWTKLHIDFCQRYPNSSVFQKLWKPTYVIFWGWIYALKIDVNIRTGKHIFRV